MKFDVLKLIYNNMGKNNSLTESQLASLVYKLVKTKKLEGYIKEFRLVSDKSNINGKISIAKYINTKKAIYVNTEGIKELYEEVEASDLPFNDYEKTMYNYLLLIQVLLHEIEHANQSKKMANDEGIESDLLKLSTGLVDYSIYSDLILEGYTAEEADQYLRILRYNRDLNYSENYQIAPHERLADIKSWQEIQDISEFIRDDESAPNLYDYIKFIKFQKMFNGYGTKNNTITSPTIDYILANGYQDELEKFDWYDESYYTCLSHVTDKFSLEDRLVYGLPISPQEYTVINQVLEDLKIKSRRKNERLYR